MDCKSIQAWLADTYQVYYSGPGLTDLLHRLGANALVALSYKLTTGEAVLYYADAAHPTHNTRCTRTWCQTGQARPLLTVSGRERVNLNAALNAHAPTQVHLDETRRMDAQSTRRLYEKLLAAHPDTPRIYVVCDNARYYKNQELTQWLTDKPIQQVFLPPYSPNLNLIERLWKFLRQKIINTTFYRTKGAFKPAVLHFFDRLPEFGQELASRLTLNFRVLESQPTS